MVGSKDLQPSNTRFFPNVFLHNQFRTKPEWPSPSINLSEKVAIITGGNAGLGLEAASQLLSFKLSHLVLAVRSSKKGEAAARQLRLQYAKANIEVWPLDMSSIDSIQAFVRRVEIDLPRLDMVVLNAGINKPSFDTIRSTGHEETIQVNYLSTALLTILLLPILKSKSPPGTAGRLSIISSGLALAAKFPNRNEVPFLPSFDDPKYFDPMYRYHASKVLAHMFLWKLVDYVSADDVIVNLPDPGFVKGTELGRDAAGWQKVATAVFAAVTARTKKVGASTYLDALLSKGPESHGCFIMSWQIHP